MEGLIYPLVSHFKNCVGDVNTFLVSLVLFLSELNVVLFQPERQREKSVVLQLSSDSQKIHV